MKCPACTEPSTVFLIERPPRTLRPPPDMTFWDLMDKPHVHDTRPYVAFYRCQHQHRFKVTQLEECPSCAFGRDSTLVTIL